MARSSGGAQDLPVSRGSLIALLRARAEGPFGQAGYSFLGNGETETARLTYAELDRRARALGAWLQRSVAPGERVLLQFPPGLDFIAAFFGCLYGGAIAVPAYPASGRDLSRLRSLACDALPQVVLATSAIQARVESLGAAADLPPLRWQAVDALAPGWEAEWRDPGAEAGTVAFLQYTSGSTGDPKGVVVSHGNLLANQEAICTAFGQTSESVIVGWLPLYHDMGLIGTVLQPLYVGARCVLMAPTAFLQKPVRWLEAISRHRATTSGAPNFAYDLCVHKISREQREGLDLRSWSVAFDGAEPVRAETLERFARAFAPHGFRRQAFQPCYGLAEATLLVSGSRGSTAGPELRDFSARALAANQAAEPAAAGGDRVRLVGSGRIAAGQRVAVVDPETREECARGAIGEIWVAGPSVAAGYFRRPEMTAEVFQACLAGGEGPFLRTGDLGFVREGELFVTGRLKDLIILRGRNLYPQDVERAAERSHPALRPGCGAAFPVDAGGEERLVVVHEIERGRKDGAGEIIAAIRRAVAEEQEAALHDVVLLGTGRLPKTTSGKVQRRACRAAYLSGGLAGVVATARELEAPGAGSGEAAGRAELLRLEPAERRPLLLSGLRSEVARLLRVDAGKVDADLPLPSLGLDSLAAVELAGGVAERLGVVLDLSELLAGASLSGLTEAVLSALAAEPAGEAAPALAAGGPAAESPLSYNQRALWFLERLAPAGGAYHIAVAARVAAPLDPEALRRALGRLSERHPALRTGFVEGPEGPVQRVRDRVEVDFRTLEAAPGAPLQDLLEAEAYRPFDLAAGPPLRVRLIASGAEEVLLLAVHHLVADFWSLAVLAGELGRLYAADTGGEPALLEPLPLGYGDFVRWQEERLAGPEGERLWRFWSRALGGAPPDLSLPADRPRPPVQTYGGGSRGLWLPPGLSDAVRRLARERGATLYGTLLAAWLALLYRYSGQEDLVVGSPTAGRGAPALAGLVGYFVNPIAVRAAVSGAAPFGDLLERVRDTVGEALAHQAYPLALLAERLQPVRDPSRPPIFQVLFVHQRPPRGGAELGAFALHEPGFRLDLGGIALEPLRMERRRVQFDLTLIAAEVRDVVGLALEHSAGLFDGTTVERMLGHLRLLLAGAAADPGGPVDALPLLTGPELGQVRSAWNDTRVDYPEDALVHQLIEAQADRSPEAVAVVSEEETLTYRELERRANQLARHLAAMGVGPDVRVGVCLERGADLVVGLLAILKAGGAYVPLEPTDPAERLAGYLEDAAVRLTLSHERHAGRLPAGGAVVRLDRDRDVIARRGTARPGVRLAPDNLAYTLFTSGSTGRPKGAMNTHRGIANRLLWMQDAYGLTAADRVLQKTPFTFDVSVWELFWPLMTGARLVMARPGGHRDAAYLTRVIAEAGVTTVHFVPSVLGAFLDEPGLDGCAALRRVICSGEALTPELVRRAFARLPAGAELHNLYGPTEAAVDVTAWPCPREGAEALRTVPIGRPIANTRIHLLDRGLRPVPAGVPAELYIGGVQLARGYAGRPDLTAERFVPDPETAVPGARLYRTGDLARFQAGGAIEYLGRADLQVKIRGVRIELGEIEAELARHPRVRGAAVVVREEGGKRLVAYVAAAPEARPAPEALREHLRARLPEAMVPADWVILDALPLTSSGKVDRRALPAPDRLARRERTPPRTPTEQLLAGLWSQLTGRGPVCAEDDFFALGGHSLLATRVLSRVRDLWGIELPVHALFESPTLAGLARRIDAAAGEGRPSSPALEPVPRDRELPLSYAQQRLWFLDRREPGSAAYNVPGAVRLRGRLDVAALAASWSALARRHEALRTVFPDREGRPWQRILPPGDQPLPLVDLGGLPAAARGGELQRLARAEARRPFDLEVGPLVRTLLVRCGAEEHVNLVTLHHVAADGWALGIAVRDLTALYAAFSAGLAPQLPELPVQVADFAVWQRRWLEGGALEAQTAYWRRRLTPVPELLQLPTDRPRPARPGSRGGRWEMAVDAPLREALAALGRREGGTLFMTLLAGFQALLARITGQTDVAVGVPVANRNRTEIEGVIGCFVNTLVLRTDLGGGPAFREVLARVRTATLDAYAHQDLPFERLVDELRLDRDLGGTPLFRALLAFQDEALGAVALPGLTVEPVEVDNGTAKLDLALLLDDRPGGLAGSFQFAAELFDRPTVGRLAGHLRSLLAAAAADPGIGLRDLPLLAAAERQQLTIEWCDTERRFAEACVHRLVEAQVARTPEALAVVLDGSSWTYRELDARSNRLARRLRALGVGPGAVVGVCLERSPDMVAALLAVLKAGGAYLPLDPDYPAERLSFLVEDAGVRVLVARPETVDFLRVEHVVEPGSGAGSEASGVLPGGATLDDLAYVIYTSGSTGVPKGVMVPHRGICNRLLAAQGLFRLEAGDRLLQGSAFSFDFSVWEIFAPLIAGARLVLVRPGGHRDAAHLVKVCAEQGVTHVHFVPSLLQVFLEQEGLERCRSLKVVYSGGEALSAALQRRFFERLPGCLCNQYGPTEASVDLTWWNSWEGVAGPVVPIGRPYFNVRLYGLDPEMRPVPVGVHGELHVAGVQLARGYLGRPDATAHRFVPDPFAADGGRLYRTGDLVRFLADGNVDYLGRLDHQVKVRGFRIELEEIEAVLVQHPGVREAAAAAVEVAAGDRRLAAWIVPGSGQAPSGDELRAFLGARLPEFMVPGLFTTLAALPRTGSGKLDRGALPAPERARPTVDADYVAPRTPGERLLARLWSEVLGVEPVGAHDNFFALGGDSILSIQVVSRANQAGLRLTPRQVFEHQTVAGLAAVAGAAPEAAADRGPVTGPVPLTPIQRELFEQELPDPHHYNQAVLLEVRRPLPAGLLRRALAALLEHHDALRLRFAREDGGWRQWIAAPGEEPSLLEADLTATAAGDAVLEEAADAVQASFDLGTGPLLRGVLFRRGGLSPHGADRLLLVAHHLVVDGVSWRLLAADLEAVCARLARGGAPGLPPRTTSYREWAEGLVARASDGTFAGEAAGWAAAGGASGLPLDEPAGTNRAASARTLSVALTREETAALLREVPAAYRTRVDETLLAALALGLRGWTGAGRLHLDVEAHGREDLWPGLDLSRTVGWFTSRFPLTLDLPPGDDPGEALRAVKEQVRAVPRRGTGYGVLRFLGEPAVAHRLAAAPRPELSFNYLGQLDPAVAPDDLFGLAAGPAGAARGRRGARRHLLEVDGGIAAGRLELTWTWSAALHRRATVEALAQRVLQALRGVIEHCRTAEAGGFTPSDFPLARLDRQSLDRIAGRDRRIEDIHPLSPTQQGILFHTLLEPGTGAYFEQMACTLRGGLDVRAFERAWHEVVDRHPALRAAFVWEGLDQPLQVVRRPVEIPWRHEDWSDGPAGEREERLAELYRQERERGFELTRAPLMRCLLVRLADGLHHFVWSHHHLLLDGWSLPLVLREVFAVYAARCRGEAPALEPARPFRDYVAWLQAQDLAAAEAFWRRSLDGFAAPTRLEADAGPGAATGAGHATAALRLEPPGAAALRALARRHQLTLSTLVQGAWALLLHRHSGAEDVVFGATVSGRPAALPGVESIVGVFINSLPVRVRAAEESLLLPWLEALQAWQVEQREHEHSPLVQVREWSPLARDLPLFETLLIFENYPVGIALDEAAGLRVEDLRFFERTHYPLTLTVAPQEGLGLALAFDRARFGAPAAARLLRDYAALLEGFAARPQGRLADLPWMSAAERQQLLVEWNDTAADAGDGDCIHRRFERQARRTPGAVALVFGRRQLTYAELDQRADALARRLRRLGAGPDVRVALCAERSLEMVTGLLAVLKAGGAYVPLDPAYPAERLALMLEDSGARVLLTQEDLLARLPASGAGVRTLLLDGPDEEAVSPPPLAPPALRTGPDHLAYVIYTSGSTGRPKGVMVPHRGVLNFFAGMDARLGREPGVWLAVTSISFDISVLEILWTLCRGFRVVLQKDAASLVSAADPAGQPARELDLSLFYFAAEEGEAAAGSYRLLLEGARFADRHGFTAVWTPERHFHAFGGQYPNPAITGAAVAAVTERIQIRAGSVVLPLHHPVRVAEDWAVIDRLSGGRVGLSFATGWHADDFVFAPASYPRRKEALLEGVETVRRLWRGEAVPFPNGAGQWLDVRIHPRPVQPELPFWITAAGNPETFRQAGALGANLLTHLLGQTLEELAEKIALYRRERRENGHDPWAGRVTLMVHTFVGDDLDTVRETVKGPFCNYLRTSLSLIRNLVVSVGMDVDPEGLSPEDTTALLEHAFDRYFEAAGLFGTPETCRRSLERFQALGVDEVACLIDFGVETERVLAALPNLAELRERARRPDPEVAAASLAAQVVRHGVTHLQCTPSLAGMLVLDGAAAAALASLRCLMVGGEAFPPALAERLAAATPAAIHNLYGPTETTIWSSTWAVPRDVGAVSIGRPIANTSLHLVDRRLRPVPLGLSGELLIGGLGVVRGYLDRPDLTAERFVPDPFGAPGSRLYRTGDLARRRPDGEVEFLGRLDHQVKIRGIRIELGEIEALLARHPLVREAVVAAREGAAGEARLVAYLVPRRPPLAGAELDEIDAFLRRSLPEAMIPSAFVPLEALPLTPNRKVDRKALPDPVPAAREAGARTAAPRTPTEEVVAEIWGAVLGVERVGVHDGFFDLGGHSLLATQVVSRVRDAFRVDLPLRSLFEAPTVEGLAQAVDRMRRQDHGAQAPPLAAGARDGELPLSFGQERIWFLNQLAPGSAYNDFTAFRLLGDLEAGALERSLGEIVRRHETLRTAFAAAAGRPRPVVDPAARLAMPVVDLRPLPAAERHAALERLARQEARALFDLGRAPLLRALLLRLGPQEHALCLTIHHIATDGWSWRVLFRELAGVYAAFAAGRPSPLPALPIQYVDFARWQRQWLRGEVLERQLAYWRERLEGRRPVLELPMDRPRPAVQSFRGATRTFALAAGLGAALRGLGRGERATLFMTLLAVFEVLLHRLSGQGDLLVGTPVANRNHSELEALIGVFVNTLVLRTGVAGELTFRELLARVREVALGAYAHQDLPFEKLVDALQVERDLSHTPLFQVAFVLQNAPLEVLELESLAIRPLEIDPGSAKFDLTLALADRGTSLQGWLEYSTDVFDAATMVRLLGQFTLLAEGAVAEPGRRLAELPLLSAAERQALLAEWGGGPASCAGFAGDATIADLFARQAEESPAGVALTCDGEELTYAELEERANRLAHFLIERGVGPEVPVGLCLDRGLDLVVALLAVLKAGGAYVPLDPSYPAERLAFMLEDAGAPVLLTRGDLPAGLPGARSAPWGARPEMVRLDERREEIERHSAERPGRRATAASSAYVIFTSGSTGRPKGVMVSHGNVVRLLRATERWFGFRPQDVWTLFHSSAFDFSVWELWGALAYGGRLVIVPFWVSRSPEAFYELLVRERVTVLNQTPSAFRQLIQAESLAGSSGELALRLVIFGGEALELRSLEPWFARHAEDQPRLVNMYGITETTVHVTYRPLSAEDARRGAGSVIGVPIPDLSAYVLDPWGNPAPPGVPGELCVGGAGLARGYLGRPELTAERFVPDPFGGTPGARLYRSGDLVRFVARGELEYLGRIDLQVKVRGFRIELGEIEAALCGHPAVREAVVAVRAGRLVAWVVPADASPDGAREGSLHAHLRGQLPDYMVPAAFVFLAALPTTPSGKVDRRALPDPGARRPDADEAFVAPRNPVEEALAAVWCEVLGRERVDVHDNFFRLGGDSILILQIVARARAAGLAITPRQIFEHQTVAELAAVVGSPGWDGGDEPVSGPVPLTPIQRWFFEREVAEPDHFNLGVLLELREGWDGAALRQAVELLPRHHDALRHRFARRDGSWHQEVAPPDGLPAFIRIDLSGLPEPLRAGALRAAAAAAQRSLDLAAGPVFRALGFDFGPGRVGRLLLAAHHLVIDGVSWRILLEDLETAYGQLLAGGAPTLPARTTSFKTWAERLLEHVRTQAGRELDTWLGIGLAAGRRSPGRLPVDLPGGENTVGSAERIEVALGSEETRALLHEVPAAYRTRIQETLLTALAMAASRWTEARALLIDLEGHGREEILPDVDLSRTVGWFTAVFPVLLDLGQAAEAGEALKAVKECYRQIPNHGLGYGLLRHLGVPEAAGRLAAQPRAELLFNYWGQLDRVLAAGALLRPAAEPVEGLVSPRARRSHLLEVNCRIADGRLRAVWTYSRSFHRAATVEAWAQSYADALRSILDHCRSAKAGGATPSDFPLVSLSQKQLDRLMRKHSRSR